MNRPSSTPESADASFGVRSASEAVVAAVADAQGVSAVDVSPPLYDVIDPDALDTITTSMANGAGASTGRVEFSYSGYDVSVSGDGRVSVTSR